MPMANKFEGLPPSKRYKLLQEEKPAPPSTASPLPVKKRIESHNFHLPQFPTTSLSLPAKKRIWAPPPLSLNETQDREEEESKSVPRRFFDLNQVAEEENEEQRSEEENVDTPKDEEKAAAEEEDDGVVCAVCQSTDGDPLNPIVFCDGCDLMVHASCYGNPLTQSIPEGDWFCSTCQANNPDRQSPPECCLCPVKGGAMKRTTSGGWAHITCALFVPEVFFRDPVGREEVDLSSVPTGRWEGTCYLCKSSSGCVIECSEPKCRLAFHASCGLGSRLCVEYKESRGGGIVVGFCEEHTELWKKQQVSGKFRFVPRDEEGAAKKKN